MAPDEDYLREVGEALYPVRAPHLPTGRPADEDAAPEGGEQDGN
jgi:hypothetical protein